jgi:hypothetical protein
MALTKVPSTMIKGSTLTYQIPTDFATLQAAIDALSPTVSNDVITLNIETGHQPAVGISVSNGDYSQFRITSTDAEVTLSASFGTTQKFIYGEYAKLPILACLVNANSQASFGYAAYYGSTGFVESGCGVKNVWGTGCQAYGASQIYAANTIWTNCAINGTTGSGLTSWNSVVNADDADVSDSKYYGVQAAHAGMLSFRRGIANDCFRYAIRATDAGWLDADGAQASRAGGVAAAGIGYGFYAFNGSWIAARDGIANDCKSTGVIAAAGSNIHVRGGSFTGCGEYGVRSTGASTIDATLTDVSDAGIFGYFAEANSNITAGSSVANDCGGVGVNNGAAYAQYASTINVLNLTATGASGIAIRAESNSTIHCANSTITGAGNRAVYASGTAVVSATDVTGTGAGNEGAFAASGSTINVQSSNFQRGGSPSSDDIKVDNGSFINAASATGGLSQTANTVTADGIIFQ